jgi:hypothetical protein
MKTFNFPPVPTSTVLISSDSPKLIRGHPMQGVLEYDNGDIFVKVKFPITLDVPGIDTEGRTEHMWVLVETGDEFNGTGRLDNDPSYSLIPIGALIEFQGSLLQMPQFVRVILS